jgi:2-succinyl-6-hydroxy-2,4-cyclohexadiene-1-carboxylate synthase
VIGLLHGFAGDPSVWADVRVPDAARVPMLPGHGDLPVQRGWDANLAAVADQLDGADLVVGYSLGARVALGLVATGRIAGAILIGVNPGIADDERATRRASDAEWARVLRDDGIAAFVDRWQAQPLFATQTQVAAADRFVADRLAARRERRLHHDPEQIAQSLEQMGLAEMPDYRAHFPRDRVGLIAGDDDTKYTQIARELGAPFEAIAGSGHDPTLERPATLGLVITRMLLAARRGFAVAGSSPMT